MVDACPYDAYEKVGKEMTSRELADLLLRDKAFYDESHGGVTFSGGEPALQAEFVTQPHTSKSSRCSSLSRHRR
jgi:pyruvate formate lyase activating enzyme